MRAAHKNRNNDGTNQQPNPIDGRQHTCEKKFLNFQCRGPHFSAAEIGFRYNLNSKINSPKDEATENEREDKGTQTKPSELFVGAWFFGCILRAHKVNTFDACSSTLDDKL